MPTAQEYQEYLKITEATAGILREAVHSCKTARSMYLSKTESGDKQAFLSLTSTARLTSPSIRYGSEIKCGS